MNNAFDQFDAPTAKGNAFDQFDSAPPKEMGFFEKVGQNVMETVPKGRAGAIPAAIGGFGETVKGLGAAGELLTEKAKPITKFGENVIEFGKRLSPKTDAAQAGALASYALPFSASQKMIQAAKGSKATGLLGKTLESGAAGATTGVVTTPGDAGDRTLAGVFGGGLGILGEAVPGVYKSLKELKNAYKETKPIGTSQSFADLGKTIEKEIKPKLEKQYKARSEQAEQDYAIAKDLARKKQRFSPFAESIQGKSLVQSLEKDKTYVDPRTGQAFLRGEDQVKGIDRLIKAIKGVTSGGETVPLGKGVVASKLTKKLPTKTLEKDIDAIVEELRFLRESRNSTKPVEGYEGLNKEYREQLIKRLETHLYDWNENYGLADQRYREASEALNKFKTSTMGRALQGEKFDFTQIATSPEKMAEIFFQDSNGIRDLKAVVGPVKAQKFSADYIASKFANQSPEAIKSYAFDNANIGWMKEAGIQDAVQKYASEVSKKADKLSIAKKLGFYSAAGAIGYKGARAGEYLGSTLGF